MSDHPLPPLSIDEFIRITSDGDEYHTVPDFDANGLILIRARTGFSLGVMRDVSLVELQRIGPDRLEAMISEARSGYIRSARNAASLERDDP